MGDQLKALPEMVPSAEERAERVWHEFDNARVPYNVAMEISLAYRDGQSSTLAALKPLIEASKRRVQYVRYHGEIPDAERSRIRRSALYARGDTILVWVNEGRIIIDGDQEFVGERAADE